MLPAGVCCVVILNLLVWLLLRPVETYAILGVSNTEWSGVFVGPLLFLYAVLKVFANHPGVIFPGCELLLFKVPNLAINENWAY